MSRIQASDIVFAPGAARLADPRLFSDAATEMTLGFNWYLNRWARVQFNWETCLVRSAGPSRVGYGRPLE